ncbi:hypothetical protein V2A60_001354 [Cordyceps javanica]|uniref:Peptidase S1 and S6, chymotrypsin/Hap n=1 Tax=Cordyceps javanica TaxID=43265 RepID=A0A545WBV9_9HYPO|nr:peptidase S1 and S6, chymotrypsin/Hap [Cordyceps javanica]TQW11448.1 peptidase S1 and S6, chymotrypsin/Hap [Cordyceps javanica]
MKLSWIVSLGTLAAWPSSANPLVIDQATFKANGGDVNDIANSIKTHNDVLQSYSFNTPWLVVGDIGGCTATWLGDKDNYTYVLTAAHCIDYKGEVTYVDRKFTAWDGRVIAGGRGIAYVPPQRIKVPEGMGGASTDIAILEIPTLLQIVGHSGRPLERPILNDALDENGLDVIFVGYGVWGVGTQQSGLYGPATATGTHRLYARGRIDRIFESDYGIGATYQPTGPSANWGRVAPGDSGSAWWQIRKNRPTIVATTNGGHGTLSTGARVSKYIGWIQSKYPDVRRSSTEGPRGCIVSVKTNDAYCLTVGQSSGYSLPSWIYDQQVYVRADPGTAVQLSDYDNLSYNRLAKFDGTVENSQLKAVKANNGQTLDFSHPHSMRVVASTTALGCIVSLTSVELYCLPKGKSAGYSLPSRIYGHDVQAEGSAAGVMLSDWDNLSYNRIATFNKLVQNWELKKVRAVNGEVLDFSRPKSMRVV